MVDVMIDMFIMEEVFNTDGTVMIFGGRIGIFAQVGGGGRQILFIRHLIF